MKDRAPSMVPGRFPAACRLAVVLACVTAPALAQEAPVLVELNRLEERGADCRAYLLLDNRVHAQTPGTSSRRLPPI